MDGVLNTMTNEVDANCAMISVWKQICLDDTATCQLSNIEIETSENSLRILSQTLYTLSGTCKMRDFPSSDVIIERCHKGNRWTTREGITEKFTFLDHMMQGYYNHASRDKRLVVSGPIAIATATCLFSTFTTVGASIAIAEEEGNRVYTETKCPEES